MLSHTNPSLRDSPNYCHTAEHAAQQLSWLRSPHGAEYYHYTDKLNFTAARSFCHQHHGQLARVVSPAIETYLVQLVKYSQIWIGVQQVAYKTYRAIDDTVPMYTHWYKGQPDCTATCCGVYLDTDQTWMSKECGYQLSFVCEKRVSEHIHTFNQTLQDVSGRVDRLEAAIAGGSLADMKTQVWELENRLAGISGQVSDLKRSQESGRESVDVKIADIRTDVNVALGMAKDLKSKVDEVNAAHAKTEIQLSGQLEQLKSVHSQDYATFDNNLEALRKEGHRNVSQLEQHLQHVLNARKSNDFNEKVISDVINLNNQTEYEADELSVNEQIAALESKVYTLTVLVILMFVAEVLAAIGCVVFYVITSKKVRAPAVRRNNGEDRDKDEMLMNNDKH